MAKPKPTTFLAAARTDAEVGTWLALEPVTLDRMVQIAQIAAPRECCGLVIGQEAWGRLALGLTNWASAEDSFQLGEDFLVWHRRLRTLGWSICAYFHSHPRGSPWPSQRDYESSGDWAWPMLILAPDTSAGSSWRFRGFRRSAFGMIQPVWLTLDRVQPKPSATTDLIWRQGVVMERTLVLLKPDAVARRLVGKILARFEEKGLWIIGMKHMVMTMSLAEQHYDEHKAKPFFGELAAFMTSSPLVALVLEGPDAIALVRKMIGKTKVLDAEPGTIRGDYAASTQQNLVHASDSPESATREIAIWFKPEELTSFNPCDGKWVTEKLAAH